MSRAGEVGIVGAGIAGLVAAHHLSERGMAVRLFEARADVGGRIRTVSAEALQAPLELGAEFVHGSPEPTMALADALDVGLEPVNDRHARYSGGSVRDMGDVWGRFAHLLEGVGGETDVTAAEFLRRKKPNAGDAEMFRLIVEGFDAAPLDEIGVNGIAEEARSIVKDGAQWRPVGGYGGLVERLARKLHPALVEIRPNSVVEQIEWRPGGGCALHVRNGTAGTVCCVQRCIVTVPLGVLASSDEAGSLKFSPAVPALERPCSLLAMGRVVKLVLILRETEWLRSFPAIDFVHLPEGPFPTLWHREVGDVRVVTLWVGGSRATPFESLDPRDLVDQATTELAECCRVAPADVRDAILGAHHHDFDRDPFSLGAYPYARPGGTGCQSDLAEPIAETLYFAGDATDTEHFGTVAGAIASGARAARQILALGSS